MAVRRPGSAIFGGAVLYATECATFDSRKARLIYGLSCGGLFDSKNPKRMAQSSRHRVVKGQIKEPLSESFSRHIVVGDNIPLNNVYEKRVNLPDSQDETPFSYAVYVRPDKVADFDDEHGCYKFGSVGVP